MLIDIYPESIINRCRNTLNHRKIDFPTLTNTGYNSKCGDEISLEIKIVDNIITDITFNGAGCVISQASADIMVELLRNKDIVEANRIYYYFVKMINDEEIHDIIKNADVLELKDVLTTSGRKECSLLAWNVFNNCIKMLA